MTRLRSLVLLPLAVVVAASVNACGDDAASTSPAPSGVTGGGAAGSASGGAAGKATGGTSAGGPSKGGANSGGTASGGTSAGGTSAGTSSGGTNAGGSKGGCTKDDDCAGVTVLTKPEGCAQAYCKAGACAFRSKDADGDGFRANKCQALTDDPVEVEVGKDCDDSNKDVNPAGWDGPAGDGHPDACGDGVDQNCSGADGDDQLANGASCACQPGDVSDCSETAGGVPVVFPGGSPAPGSACRRGKKTCENDPTLGGKFGPCIGTVGVQPETCNSIDDDCDGKTDEEDALDPVEWIYDGDGDNQGAMFETPGSSPPVRTPFATVKACLQTKPSVVPVECTAAYCGAKPIEQCCPKDAWRLNIPKTDCDDRNNAVFAGAVETCGNGSDDNCDGKQDEPGAVGEKDWVFDGDGDKVASNAIGTKRSCAKPGCDAVTGTDCADKWTTGLPTNDCDDTNALVNPNAKEDCATAFDDNCNGSNKDSCNCAPGTDLPLDCGLPTDCNYVKGGSVCGADGKYAACPAAIDRIEHCPDVDNDGYCLTGAGSCGLFCATGANNDPAVKPPAGYIRRELCANASTGIVDCNDADNTVRPGGQELCGDGKNSNCSGGNEDSDGYDVAGVCDVQIGNADGACKNGGRVACVSPGATTTTCAKQHTDIGSTKQQIIAAPNKSFDWNCDGEVTVKHTPCLRPFAGSKDCNCSPQVTFKLGDAVTNPSQWTVTNLLTIPNGGDNITCADITTAQGCATEQTRYFVPATDCDFSNPKFPCAKGACGSTLLPLRCKWDATTKCTTSSNKVYLCQQTDGKGNPVPSTTCN